MPHPAVLIFLWMCVTVALQPLHAAGLLLAGLPLLATAFAVSAARLRILLRRTRWIMLSLLLIYAYATPGDPVWVSVGEFSPTYQGLGDGALQLWRLACALGGLAILLKVLPQQQLVSGLYALAYPLHLIGLSRERLAVRLALTLEYAESAMRHGGSNWRGRIEQMLAPADTGRRGIELHVAPFTLRDGVLVVIGCMLPALVLL